jgi:DNA polymerase I-like protein with 3'-5' exonuclease and polymerase domains
MTIREFITTNDRVFVDIETNYGDLILIHALLDDAGNQFCVDGTHTAEIINAINSRTTPLEIVGFSITFDLGHYSRNGLDLNKVIMRDLRAMYIMCNNTSPRPKQLNLPLVLSSLLNVQMSKAVRDEFKGMTIAQLQPRHFTYAMNDLIYLPQVDKLLTNKLLQHDLVDAYNFEMEFQKCLIIIETNGMLIDVDKAQKFYDDEVLKRQTISDNMFNKHGVRPGTTDAFKNKLLEVGYKLPFTINKKGKYVYSIAADILASLEPIPGDDILPSYFEFKSQENLCNLIYKPETPKKESGSILTNVKSDNRVHPWFDSLGTVTGRLTASRPNVLAMNKGIRPMFIAPENSKIVSIDFSAQEPLVGASLAKCQKSLDKYYDPAGYHNANLKIIYKTLYNEDLDEKEFKTKMFNSKKSYRDLVKIIGLGIMYGMSAGTAANRAGDASTKSIFTQMISVLKTPELVLQMTKNAKQVLEKSYLQYSPYKHKIFIDHNLKQYLIPYFNPTTLQEEYHYDFVVSDGDIKVLPNTPNPLSGGTNNLSKVLSELNNEIKNYPIQGNSGVILKSATIELTKLILSEYPTAKIINLVHDEIVFEVPDSIVDEFVPKAELIMQEISIPLLGNKLKTETTINTYWKK